MVPVNDHLKRIERLAENEWDVQDKLSVSFAGLIDPSVSGHKTEVIMRECGRDGVSRRSGHNGDRSAGLTSGSLGDWTVEYCGDGMSGVYREPGSAGLLAGGSSMIVGRSGVIQGPVNHQMFRLGKRTTCGFLAPINRFSYCLCARVISRRLGPGMNLTVQV